MKPRVLFEKNYFLISDWNDKKKRNLQGRVRFPTGGKAREPRGMIRCDSGADSIVWMKEDDGTVILIDECSV